MIDHLQVVVLSFPAKILGVVLFAVSVAVIDPFIGAIGMLILSTTLAFLTAWYWFQKNAAVKERDRIAAEHEKLVKRVEDIERQSHVLAQAMLPVSAAFQAILVKELTHMHTPEMDALMAKLGPPFTLTTTESERLASLLEARTRDMGDEFTASERDAAIMMPALMRRVREEAEAEADRPAPQHKLVAMTAVVEIDGVRRALLIPTQSSDLHSAVVRVEKALGEHDVWERGEREALTAVIVENSRLTREANEAAHELLRSKK